MIVRTTERMLQANQKIDTKASSKQKPEPVKLSDKNAAENLSFTLSSNNTKNRKGAKSETNSVSFPLNVRLESNFNKALLSAGVPKSDVSQLIKTISKLPIDQAEQFKRQIVKMSQSNNLQNKFAIKHISRSVANPYSIKQNGQSSCVAATAEFVLAKNAPHTYAKQLGELIDSYSTTLPSSEEIPLSLFAGSEKNTLEQKTEQLYQSSMLKHFASNPDAGFAQDKITNGSIWSQADDFLQAQFGSKVESIPYKNLLIDNNSNLLRELDKGNNILLYSDEHASVITGYTKSRRGVDLTVFEPVAKDGEKVYFPLQALRTKEISNTYIIKP